MRLIFEPCHVKTHLCLMWTTKLQISLHIHTVWSVSLLFKIYSQYDCMKFQDCYWVGWFESHLVAQLKRQVFSWHGSFEPPQEEPNKMTACPAKTQISLGIHPVWSESSLCAQWIAKDPSFLHADSEDWSDWADAQADLSLRWVHISFCWFRHEVAHFFSHLVDWIIADMLASAQGSIGSIRYILKNGLKFFPLYGFYFRQVFV